MLSYSNLPSDAHELLVSQAAYHANSYYLRWWNVVLPFTNWNLPTDMTADKLEWAEANCKSRYCSTGRWSMAFEDRREAMMFKLAFT